MPRLGNLQDAVRRLLCGARAGGMGGDCFPETLLGTIFRLFGADAVIYPHWGGRFGYSADVCRNLAERLRCTWNSVRPALPVPAGGMALERAAELIAFYGVDTMLLIGGSLYEAGDALYERSRSCVEAVHRTAALADQG